LTFNLSPERNNVFLFSTFREGTDYWVSNKKSILFLDTLILVFNTFYGKVSFLFYSEDAVRENRHQHVDLRCCSCGDKAPTKRAGGQGAWFRAQGHFFDFTFLHSMLHFLHISRDAFLCSSVLASMCFCFSFLFFCPSADWI